MAVTVGKEGVVRAESNVKLQCFAVYCVESVEQPVVSIPCIAY
jgi:hypothetical protein